MDRARNVLILLLPIAAVLVVGGVALIRHQGSAPAGVPPAAGPGDSDRPSSPQEKTDASDPLSVTVKDSGGKPISGATVEIARGGSSLTDDAGVARIPMPPGTARITISRQGFHPFNDLYHPKAGVRVAAFVLYRESVLTGKVVDRKGPVAGAIVRVEEKEAATDRNGVFSFRDLRPTKQLIEVLHPTHLKKRVELVVLEEGTTADIELLLLDSRIQGTVSDESGTPIAGAKVIARLRLDGRSEPRGDGMIFSQWNADSRGTATDAAGHYSLALPAAAVEMTIDHEGYLPFVAAEILDVKAGTDLRKDWQLQRGHGLDVLVRDAQDAPVVDAAVRLTYQSKRRIGDPHQPRESSRKTDSRGIATFGGLKPGDYLAECDLGFEKAVVPGSRQVVIRPGFARVSGRLMPEGALPGEGEELLTYVSFAAVGELTFSTRGDGKSFGRTYSFEKLAPGTYAVYAFAPPDKVVVLPKVVLNPGDNVLDLSPRAGSRISGRYVGAGGKGTKVLIGVDVEHTEGNPASVALVQTYSTQSGLSSTRNRFGTNEAGEFDITGIPPSGAVTLTFFEPGSSKVLKTVRVDASRAPFTNLGMIREK